MICVANINIIKVALFVSVMYVDMVHLWHGNCVGLTEVACIVAPTQNTPMQFVTVYGDAFRYRAYMLLYTA